MPPVQPNLIVSKTVAASPALAAETTIAQITVPSVADATSQVELSGWAAFTVGTTGNSARLRIRSGSLTGTVVADTGALTGGIVAAALVAQDVEGVDQPAEIAGLVYVLTLQVGAATAPSTVSAVKLRAWVTG